MNETEQKVYWVAFDVASEKMDVAAGISRWQKPTWTAQNIQNKEKELKKYLQKAKKQAEAAGRPLRLACESTGVYHRLLERCAAEMDIPICVLPPNRVYCFAKAEREQEKTDPGDAALIMRYAMTYSPRITPYDPMRYKLQEMVGLRVQLAEDLGQYKTRLQTTKCEQTAAFSQRQIAFLEEQIEEVEREIENFLTLRSALDPRIKVLRAEKGIGVLTLSVLVAYFDELGTLGRSAAAKLLGVAPMRHESGKYKGETHIRGGRSVVRRALYMSVISRLKCDPETRRRYAAYRDPHRKNGALSHKAACIALVHGFICHLETIAKHALAETGYIPTSAQPAPKRV